MLKTVKRIIKQHKEKYRVLKNLRAELEALDMDEGEKPIFMKIQNEYPESENFIFIFVCN